MTAPRWLTSARLAIVAALIGLGAWALVPANGQRASSPGSDAGSFEVGGIDVDVLGRNADAARMAGWRMAQRKGWAMLSRRLTGHPGSLSDGALDSLVSGIVVENEQIGPTRYIARLGVMFDRGKAGSILGVAGGGPRSLPMLLVPVEYGAGTAMSYEQKNDWQQAWNRFRTGNSSIDYVRPTGTGADSLLMNAGQAERHGRAWWRMIVDQYGAADVLVPEVHLYRQWPGGPVVGVFSAKHGPDGVQIARFTLKVARGEALGSLLDAGVAKIDQAYQAALANNTLGLDKAMSYRPPAAKATDDTAADEATTETDPGQAGAQGNAISVQFDTPNAGAVTAGEQSMRGVPGVTSAVTNSMAIGGVSVMRVTFTGDVAALKAALESRGWLVLEGGGTLRIRRPMAMPNVAPAAGTPPGG